MELNGRYSIMIIIFLMQLTIIFYVNAEITESVDDCNDAVCLKIVQETSTIKTEIETIFENDSEQIVTENVMKYQKENKNENDEIFSEILHAFQQDSIDIENVTIMINFTETIEEPLITTTNVTNFTEKSNKNISSLDFLPLNSTLNGICFCDLTFNQCDINCCCDKECSAQQFEIFTKCNDAEVEDKNYCLKTSFVLKNNSLTKIIQNPGGLFCIVRDNSQSNHNFKAKSILTSLESFDKSLPKNFFTYWPKTLKKLKFIAKDYKFGLPVWAVYNNKVVPFDIPSPSVGYLCSSKINLKFMMHQVSKCSYIFSRNDCGVSKIKNLLNYLKNIKIICNPGTFNNSQTLDPTKVCLTSNCIGISTYICEFSSGFPCSRISDKFLNWSKFGCWDRVSKVVYHVIHNGSEGIQNFDAYLWIKKGTKESGNSFFQKTEVKYSWAGSSEKTFQRSGNPGYLIGKPILAGRKIHQIINGTVGKKEAIELSLDPKDWLNVVGSEKGICSSTKRIPINFKENSQFLCSLELTKDMFSKDKCTELQSVIFRMLLGDEIVNATTENYFNKFVATFGNSRVEDIESWVQVIIDLFPVISSQVGFKPNFNNLMCKNMITELYVDIAFANAGKFTNPQSKILGVFFRFGEHKDITYYCDIFGCANAKSVQYFKLMTIVSFVDFTEPAVDVFAEPLGLEIKLPHDFFYPFFSKSLRLRPVLSTFVFLSLLINFL